VSFALVGGLIGAGDQRFLARAMFLAATVTLPVMVATRLVDLGIGRLWGIIWLYILARSVILLVRIRGDRWQVVDSSLCLDCREQAQPSTTDGSGTRSRANHWKVFQPNDSGPRLRATCLAVSSLMGWGSTALT